LFRTKSDFRFHRRDSAFREKTWPARALDRFEILLRDDHVGVDIGDFERRRGTGEGGKFFHFLGPAALKLAPHPEEFAKQASQQMRLASH